MTKNYYELLVIGLDLNGAKAIDRIELPITPNYVHPPIDTIERAQEESVDSVADVKDFKVTQIVETITETEVSETEKLTTSVKREKLLRNWTDSENANTFDQLETALETELS